jgi:hypothetical protein
MFPENLLTLLFDMGYTIEALDFWVPPISR